MLLSLLAVYRLQVEFPEAIDEPDEWRLELVGEWKLGPASAQGRNPESVTLTYPHLVVPLQARPLNTHNGN